jgi:hypothetical protein
MKFRIIATALVAAIAASSISLPAFADNKKPTIGAIVPALAGPLAVAASIPSTTTHPFFIVKDFHFKIWQKWGWQKLHYLKDAGFRVTKTIYKHKIVKVHAVKKGHYSRTNSTQGQAIVGCVMGSALGAITASIRKGNAMGNPLRWRSQAQHEAIVKSGVEKKYELTSDEAATALAFCGLGSLALHWDASPAPAAVVKAKY